MPTPRKLYKFDRVIKELKKMLGQAKAVSKTAKGTSTIEQPSISVEQQLQKSTDATRLDAEDLTIQEFRKSLKDRKNYKKIADNLFDLSHFIENKRKKILNPSQVEQIYDFILDYPDLEAKLKALKVGGKPLLIKKSTDGIIRTVYIKKEIIDGKVQFPIWLLPMSKLSDNSKDPSMKFLGASKSVTYEYQINPALDMIKNVSKRIVLRAPGESLAEKHKVEKALKNELGTENQFDTHPTTISIPEYNGKKGLSTRLSTDEAICDLEHLSKGLYEFDSEYIAAMLQKTKETSDPDELAAYSEKLKQQINLRLIDDLMQHLLFAHTHSKAAIHQDIKPNNILIYFDDNGRLRAKHADWGQYVEVTKKASARPLATIGYDSPQISGKNLFNMGSHFPYFWNYDHASYGRELFADNEFGKVQSLGSKRISMMKEMIVDLVIMKERGLEGAKQERYLQRKLDEIPTQDSYLAQKPDEKNDVFALGITIFMQLTGCYPTSRQDKVDDVAKDYTTTNGTHVKMLYKLDKEVFAQYPFLKNMLSYDLALRYTMAEATAAWQDYLNSQNPRISRGSPPPLSDNSSPDSPRLSGTPSPHTGSYVPHEPRKFH